MQHESEFYPPVLFKYSPVYHTWVKLFASDVYTLRAIKGFEDGPALFWLNHPIRWVHLLGVVVAMEKREKKDLIALDDASGRIIELVLKEDQHRQLVPELSDTPGLLEIGTRIKVRGTFFRSHGRRQIRVIKLETVHDPNVEVAGWEERLRLKRDVLSKVWRVDSELKQTAIQSTSRKHEKLWTILRGLSKHTYVSFRNIGVEDHTIQNFERLLLYRLVETDLHEFTISILRLDAEIEFAANCVVSKALKQEEALGKMNGIRLSQSTEVCRTIRNCLQKLIENGLILCIDQNSGVYSTLGEWNLQKLIRKCCREALYQWKLLKQQNLIKEKVIITNRDIWLKIRNHNNEWHLINKRLTTNIIEKVMSTLSGWYYAGKGQWILDK
ncbi:hypothetical protein PCANB_001879 [Pneumocystis canis]|nr:hypothetical protein PCK1_002154 [Pneumocystis canis]KAG5440309.1 hypothetical protein PCANB_001879 [Pneumocystis canis]